MRRHTVAHCLVFLVLAWLLARAARADDMTVRLPVAAAPATDPVLAHLRLFEGYHVQPYRDPADRSVWCVGLGHSLTAHGQPVRARYSDAEIAAFYRADLAATQRACRAAIVGFDSMPPQVQLVAISVTWTVGPTGLDRFAAFRRALNRHSYRQAAAALASSKWATQVSRDRLDWCVRTLSSQ